MMEELNYYELLEVSENAPKSIIQEAYLSSRALFSQDSMVSYNFFSPVDREALLERLREAYSTLMNDEKRIHYDKKIFHRIGGWYSPPPEGAKTVKGLTETTQPKSTPPQIRLSDFRDGRGLLSLSKLREALSIRVEDISRITRIRVPMILALESRDFRNLPPAIYVKGHLKSYATTLGVDPKELIQSYGPLG